MQQRLQYFFFIFFVFFFVFFFKQKTAYEIRNCDWSSDVCSSDLSVFSYNFRYVLGPTIIAHGKIWRKMKY